ncbi:hypothetical protein Glove_91g55 [Diversispora epigaea]|uniref:Uncharacterized protein n=1 Tax=Diversispora epigaea TaxID=1348612 RepID=A0A397J5E4_9GLOM|nr:hypothetical protein Glove_91g55 [Diversispora epigaea]
MTVFLASILIYLICHLLRCRRYEINNFVSEPEFLTKFHETMLNTFGKIIIFKQDYNSKHQSLRMKGRIHYEIGKVKDKLGGRSLKFFDELSQNLIELLNDKDDYNVIIEVENKEESFTIHSDSLKFFDELSQNLIELLNDKDDYNVIIEVENKEESFTIHSDVLKFRSRRELENILSNEKNIKMIIKSRISAQIFNAILH